jgi:hypothetical protein
MVTLSIKVYWNPQKQKPSHKMGKNIMSLSTEPHTDRRSTYSGVRPCSPRVPDEGLNLWEAQHTVVIIIMPWEISVKLCLVRMKYISHSSPLFYKHCRNQKGTFIQNIYYAGDGEVFMGHVGCCEYVDEPSCYIKL